MMKKRLLEIQFTRDSIKLKKIMWINLQRKRKRRIIYNEEEEEKICNIKTREEEDREMRKVAVWAFKKKIGMKV